MCIRDRYHSQNISQAVYGFREMGAEIVRYQKISDIYESVTKEDIVLDYITQVEMILKKFGVVPACEDYPVELRKFMGRNVRKDTINSINTHPEKWGVFVKPVKSKAFTGHVIRSSKDLIGCGSCYENYEVLCCDVIAPKMEWRGFIIYDELVDIRPYRGDYHYHFDAEVVDQIVEAFRTIRERPMGGSLDFAVIEKNGKLQTIDKKRGNKLALKAMVERFNANYDPSVLKTVYLSCADCTEDADMLKALIEECRPEAEVKITMLSPIIGAHTGPDMLSLIYKANSSYEKVGVLTEFLDRYRMLQMLFRVCVEQKVITERKYASFGLLLEKIGKQATSWKQYNERGMKKQEDKRQ